MLTDFIFYALFAPACGGMINRIMYASESVMEADEAMLKLDEIMNQKPLKAAEHPQRPQGTQVEFDHVTFCYPGMERPALKDVSFTVPEGAVIGLVGPSGGGKSTAAALIPRFWDVVSGSVRIGGVDVRDKIVVLSGGAVAEEGTPAQLLKRDGIFAHMARLQSESQQWVLG